MDLGGWLRSLGLERYDAAFRANAIDADVLCDLTDQDLEKLGVLLGHRRKLLRAIAALDDALVPATARRATPSPIARDQRSTAGASETHFEAPASGECGHVTVMFCGLVDSNGSSPSPDAEEWRGLVGAYLDAASIAVTECDGKVAEKLDDGLIALFGYPVTQENDLERAVQVARVIQRSVTELNRRNNGKPTLAARIVIESGPTVIDGGSYIFGALPKVAARAQAVAEPNSLIVATQQRQIPVAEERDSRKRKGTREVGLNRTVNDGRPMSYHRSSRVPWTGLTRIPGKLAGRYTSERVTHWLRNCVPTSPCLSWRTSQRSASRLKRRSVRWRLKQRATCKPAYERRRRIYGRRLRLGARLMWVDNPLRPGGTALLRPGTMCRGLNRPRCSLARASDW